MLRSKTEDDVKGRQAGATHIYQLEVVSYLCVGHLVRQVVIAGSLTILHSTSMKHKSSPHTMQAAIRFPMQVTSLGQGVLIDGVRRGSGEQPLHSSPPVYSAVCILRKAFAGIWEVLWLRGG